METLNNSWNPLAKKYKSQYFCQCLFYKQGFAESLFSNFIGFKLREYYQYYYCKANQSHFNHNCAFMLAGY